MAGVEKWLWWTPSGGVTWFDVGFPEYHYVVEAADAFH